MIKTVMIGKDTFKANSSLATETKHIEFCNNNDNDYKNEN